MLLLFPCPGTISVPSCWPSCQTSCCAPPLSGCITAASSRLSTAPTMTRTPSCGRGSAPSPSRWVAGRDRLRQPPQGLHGSGHHTWQSAFPRLNAGQSPRQSRHHQAGLVCRPTGFSTFFSGDATRRSQNCFPTQ